MKWISNYSKNEIPHSQSNPGLSCYFYHHLYDWLLSLTCSVSPTRPPSCPSVCSFVAPSWNFVCASALSDTVRGANWKSNVLRQIPASKTIVVFLLPGNVAASDAATSQGKRRRKHSYDFLRSQYSQTNHQSSRGDPTVKQDTYSEFEGRSPSSCDS